MITSPAEDRELICLIGVAGAGKSTARQELFPTVPWVSLDVSRAQLSPCGCTANQDPALCAYAVEMAVSGARAILGPPGTRCMWDATNTERSSRAHVLVLAAELRARATAVVVNPALDQALKSNNSRDPRRCWCGYARRVPDQVIRAMHATLTKDLPGLPDEGWDDVLTCTAPGVLIAQSGRVRPMDLEHGPVGDPTWTAAGVR